MSSYYLPPEIWPSIFRIATTCPAYQRLHEIDYTPFHDLPDEEELKMIGDVNSTKLSLVLVCKEWHVLAARFFYKDIRISHGLQGLYDSLKRSIDEAEEGGYGAFVRRIELSMMEFENPDPGTRTPITLADILELCPHVEIITKMEDDLLHHVVNSDSTFESLKRFDWWYPNSRHHIRTDYDDPSDGLNFLHDVTSQASNLRYLSIGRRLSYSPTYHHSPLSLRFPALTILRTENLRPFLLGEIQNWEFPRLTHLIADQSIYRADLIKLGARIEVLELIRGREFMDDLFSSNITHLLAGCPNLLEINFHIEYTRPLRERDTSHSSVRRIRLHGLLNFWFNWHEEYIDRPTEPPVPSLIWKHYEDHFWIFSTSFPALEHIVLHGDWSTVIRDSRFHLLKDPLIARGCVLQYDHDNGVVDTLS